MKIAVLLGLLLLSVPAILAGWVYAVGYAPEELGEKQSLPSLATLWAEKGPKGLLYPCFGLVLVLGLLVASLLLQSRSVPDVLRLLALLLVLLPAAAIDLRKNLIPNRLLLIGLVARVLLYGGQAMMTGEIWTQIKGDLIAAVGIGLFFLVCLLVMKQSIGMGDVKLFALLGLYLGLAGGIGAIFCSLVASFLVSVVLLLGRKKGRKDALPFAPFVLAGTYLCMLLLLL